MAHVGVLVPVGCSQCGLFVGALGPSAALQPYPWQSLPRTHSCGGRSLRWDRQPCPSQPCCACPGQPFGLSRSEQPHFRSGILCVAFLGCGLVKGTNTVTISLPRGHQIIVALFCLPAGHLAREQAERARSARAGALLLTLSCHCPGRGGRQYRAKGQGCAVQGLSPGSSAQDTPWGLGPFSVLAPAPPSAHSGAFNPRARPRVAVHSICSGGRGCAEQS